MENKTYEEKQERLSKIIETLSNNNNLSLKEIADLYKEGKDLVTSLNSELDKLKEMVSNEVVEN